MITISGSEFKASWYAYSFKYGKSPFLIMVMPQTPRLMTSNLVSSLSRAISYEGYDLVLGSEEHDPYVIESPTEIIRVIPYFLGYNAGRVIF